MEYPEKLFGKEDSKHATYEQKKKWWHEISEERQLIKLKHEVEELQAFIYKQEIILIDTIRIINENESRVSGPFISHH